VAVICVDKQKQNSCEQHFHMYDLLGSDATRAAPSGLICCVAALMHCRQEEIKDLEHQLAKMLV
jgi:hypothetical protein